MNNVIQKSITSGWVAVDLVKGTGSTAKACMVLPWHLSFIWCGVDLQCYRKSVIFVVELFRASPQWQIWYSRQVKCNGCREGTGFDAVSITARRTWMFWDATSLLCPIQSFIVNITHRLPNRFKDTSVYQIARLFRSINGQKRRIGGSIQGKGRHYYLKIAKEAGYLWIGRSFKILKLVCTLFLQFHLTGVIVI